MPVVERINDPICFKMLKCLFYNKKKFFVDGRWSDSLWLQRRPERHRPASDSLSVWPTGKPRPQQWGGRGLCRSSSPNHVCPSHTHHNNRFPDNRLQQQRKRVQIPHSGVGQWAVHIQSNVPPRSRDRTLQSKTRRTQAWWIITMIIIALLTITTFTQLLTKSFFIYTFYSHYLSALY